MDGDELNAHLDEVLIGGREQRPIVIAEYDPTWPERFRRERERIDSALGDRAQRIDHIGSTAVPGLAAKPIVDVLVAVDDIEDEGSFGPPLEAAGYVLRVREPGHRMYRTPDLEVHIHVWPRGNREIRRHLLFRDWLRVNQADRRAYEALKRSLARRDWEDMNHYANAKATLIDEILTRAEIWALAVGWIP